MSAANTLLPDGKSSSAFPTTQLHYWRAFVGFFRVGLVGLDVGRFVVGLNVGCDSVIGGITPGVQLYPSAASVINSLYPCL